MTNLKDNRVINRKIFCKSGPRFIWITAVRAGSSVLVLQIWHLLLYSEQVLHLWLETLCSCVDVVEKWYQPWSFMRSPGWVQIKCELRSVLSDCLSPSLPLSLMCSNAHVCVYRCCVISCTLVRTAELAALVWACAAKTWWLGEEMYGVWSRGSKTKRKTKEDLERGCPRGLSCT